jgi:hypothetical protein
MCIITTWKILNNHTMGMKTLESTIRLELSMCYYKMWQAFFKLGSFRKIYGLQNYIGIW